MIAPRPEFPMWRAPRPLSAVEMPPAPDVVPLPPSPHPAPPPPEVPPEVNDPVLPGQNEPIRDPVPPTTA